MLNIIEYQNKKWHERGWARSNPCFYIEDDGIFTLQTFEQESQMADGFPIHFFQIAPESTSDRGLRSGRERQWGDSHLNRRTGKLPLPPGYIRSAQYDIAMPDCHDLVWSKDKVPQRRWGSFFNHKDILQVLRNFSIHSLREVPTTAVSGILP